MNGLETNYPHLSEKTAEKLSLPDAERIEFIRRPRWIGYPRAQEILAKLEDLLVYPKQPRMPNMVIVGETNNGKTMLLNHFRQKHPADPNLQGDAVRIPVLYIQAPPTPDEAGFYNAILRQLFARQPVESVSAKRDRVLLLLQKIELGVIAVDELNSLLSGPALKQRACLSALKYLSNELCVPIVGMGTPDALRVLQIDPQIQNRFVPEVLPRWTLNADFARLLASFERLLPLREPSNLPDRQLANQLLIMSSGTIGELSRLLNEAAIWAIKHKRERIDLDALTKCGFVPPQDRKRVAATL